MCWFVLRVRYSRLSRVRRQLGYQGPAPQWSDGDKIAVDSNYMAVDIVINWAADGVVLCFIHAVVDLTPRDNDEHHKTGWTNWCGTPYMGMHEVKLLHDRLCQAVPQPPSMDRVFQILLNQPDRSLLFSWPTDRYQGQGPLSKDFAKLASEVTIGNAVSNGTDAKTSCTRRFKAQQSMQYTPEGPREVESIFIPYGELFYCIVRFALLLNSSLQAQSFSPVTKSTLTLMRRPTARMPPALATNIMPTLRTISLQFRMPPIIMETAICLNIPRSIQRRAGRGEVMEAHRLNIANGLLRIPPFLHPLLSVASVRHHIPPHSNLNPHLSINGHHNRHHLWSQALGHSILSQQEYHILERLLLLHPVMMPLPLPKTPYPLPGLVIGEAPQPTETSMGTEEGVQATHLLASCNVLAAR